MGILVEKKYGGFDGDTLALSVAVEEIARYCGGTSSIVSIHNALYADTINRLGTIEQKNNFLSDFVNGNKIGCFALSEQDSGSDAANLKTTAKKCGNEWILNGTKAWVTNGIEGEAFIVIARSNESGGHNGISAFLVPSKIAGLSRGKKEDKLGIRASSTCNIILDNVRIPNENLLGNEGEGFKIAMSAIDLARIGIASQAIGISEAALECAIKYAGQRIAFGNPIINLTPVQIRLAKMVTKIEASRLLTWKAAKLRDSGQTFIQDAAMAKLVSSETATFVTHNCIQILGGMGYIKDLPAERYYRDARITEIYAGPTDIQFLVIADNLAKKYGFKIR
ncbi:short-chain specific acyl-CoA dehydrogenase, mitochondrial-like isoform X2 [Daktulosphaira vitifoliae]|nr:short-chain specific acyl-CoA dehydrogenase, mitochondrial-like isoform X2 [Daktulosphaira vitifoliae]XP_050549195.1 short-chain specific acyl-CoA dehydrogenase, mitochondrial-like isoform X2 [Daktulosphaira vitifoliae]XP_050549196.1 short-chain specific acyl-CoA dehydrogenase, mitochondrial-like isoform X2 [Daktulosphaira vitifoliae]XP_050549197.1 short-chain specific acyl-CoA dehydrogenase, mitochondrial-like isoform X2 [Daktulosphaira vitifoliae]